MIDLSDRRILENVLRDVALAELAVVVVAPDVDARFVLLAATGAFLIADADGECVPISRGDVLNLNGVLTEPQDRFEFADRPLGVLVAEAPVRC